MAIHTHLTGMVDYLVLQEDYLSPHLLLWAATWQLLLEVENTSREMVAL